MPSRSLTVRSLPVDRSRSKRKRPPRLKLEYASRRPSGDHAGDSAMEPSEVTRLTPSPSESTV